jgi:predicted  nucleic acid-binding Zn-ribbon protein
MTKPAHEVAYPDKPCIDCGEIYERTSNVQKRCKPCAKKHEAYVPVAQRALATPVTNVPVTGAGDESQTRAPIILPETKLPVQGPGHQVIISEDRVRSALHVLDLNAIQIEAFLALIR